MFKKFVYSILIVVLALASMFAFAAGVGDKVGEVVYTDIAGYINHYPIPTYAYDGGLVVVAEDLANYGFSVSYDENARRLGINPDRSVSTISGMGGVYRNATLINRRFADALSTDITVSLGDKIIPAYAINGYMTVKLEDLADESLGIEFNWGRKYQERQALDRLGGDNRLCRRPREPGLYHGYRHMLHGGDSLRPRISAPRPRTIAAT